MKEYKQIFTAGDEPGITIIKIRLIQEMIQIQRPKNWETKRFEELVKDIVSIEKYNYKKKHQIQQFNVKWNLLR
jgi:uracil phosphoribosyltransferase